jgi:SPP1 family predicted phage head-tail adaptor
MRGGALDRRITIQRPAVVVDPVYGPQDSGWEDLLPVRIPANKKDDLPGNTESVQNGLRLSNSPARIRIRYRNDITSDMRVIVHDENDRIYQISSTPAEIGRREWLEFTVARYSS